jgi:hypothetical protein
VAENSNNNNSNNNNNVDGDCSCVLSDDVDNMVTTIMQSCVG